MKAVYFIFCFFLITSCGALKLSPQGCGSKGVWGNGNDKSELIFSQEYYVWMADLDIKLKDFLREKSFECHDIKEMRVELRSTFFVKRELKVFIKI